MRYVTWLRPYFTTIGFLASTVLPSDSAWALFKRRSLFAALSSGLYLSSILNRFVAAHMSLKEDHNKVKHNFTTQSNRFKSIALKNNREMQAQRQLYHKLEWHSPIKIHIHSIIKTVLKYKDNASKKKKKQLANILHQGAIELLPLGQTGPDNYKSWAFSQGEHITRYL